MKKEEIKVFSFGINEGDLLREFRNSTKDRSNDVYIRYRLPDGTIKDDDHVGCYPHGSRCEKVEKILFTLGAEKGEDVLIERMW